MSEHTAADASSDLFAQKGTARPLGVRVVADRPAPGAEEATARGDGTSSADSDGPASLFTIDFRKRSPVDPADLERETNGAAEPGEASPDLARLQHIRELLSKYLYLVIPVTLFVGMSAGYLIYQNRAAQDQRASSDGASPMVATPAPEVAEQEDAAAFPSTAESAAPGQSPTVVPSFDLIRIEPNGDAVIAGRAEPNSELILLDNGQPIGKVTADWTGEWAFIPDQPLAQQGHEFSLVIVTPQGTVTVPAPAQPGAATPTDEAPAANQPTSDKDVRLDLPAKPVGGELPPSAASDPKQVSADGGRYVIQLSSTTSMNGARQEVRKLQRSFPGLLGDKKLLIQQATLSQGGTRYRVRTGAFTEQKAARALCAEFQAKRQDCLVVKR